MDEHGHEYRYRKNSCDDDSKMSLGSSQLVSSWGYPKPQEASRRMEDVCFATSVQMHVDYNAQVAKQTGLFILVTVLGEKPASQFSSPSPSSLSSFPLP